MREIVNPDHPRHQLGPLRPGTTFSALVPDRFRQVHAMVGQHPQHRGFGSVEGAQPGSPVRELAVRAVDLGPLLGDLEDRDPLVVQQRVRRLDQARTGIGQPPHHCPGLPAQHPGMVDAQRGRGPIAKAQWASAPAAALVKATSPVLFQILEDFDGPRVYPSAELSVRGLEVTGATHSNPTEGRGRARG